MSHRLRIISPNFLTTISLFPYIDLSFKSSSMAEAKSRRKNAHVLFWTAVKAIVLG
jgi:hypothetical protein